MYHLCGRNVLCYGYVLTFTFLCLQRTHTHKNSVPNIIPDYYSAIGRKGQGRVAFTTPYKLFIKICSPSIVRARRLCLGSWGFAVRHYGKQFLRDETSPVVRRENRVQQPHLCKGFLEAISSTLLFGVCSITIIAVCIEWSGKSGLYCISKSARMKTTFEPFIFRLIQPWTWEKKGFLILLSDFTLTRI